MFFCFFFNDTATTEIYTLSLHDALPICLLGGINAVIVGNYLTTLGRDAEEDLALLGAQDADPRARQDPLRSARSEEHTSELQSRQYLVCRLLLEKKKKYKT